MYVLGINAYHGDSAACLVKDGILVSAAEEERFRRIKHWAGFPNKSIEFCLLDSNITLDKVDHIAINQDPYANLGKKFSYLLGNKIDLNMLVSRIKNKSKRLNLKQQLLENNELGTFYGKFHKIEHHMAHLSSAFHVSKFEEAVALSVDGFGDFTSTASGFASDTDINIEQRVFFPHSLGIYYQALTQWLGFPKYGDEYKVMGLAPYGKPTELEKMRQIVLLKDNGLFELNLEFFKHHTEDIKYEWENGEPLIGSLFTPHLEELLGPRRKKEEKINQHHMNLAHSIQARYEEVFFHILNNLSKNYKCKNLVLSGGCANNSVANGKILRNSQFENVYIPSAGGDAGGAIGAAFSVWHKLGGERKFYMDNALVGPKFSDDEIEETLANYTAEFSESNCSYENLNDDELINKTTDGLIEGKVVGWFQGRMEWGPRALGNRSILGDPRRSDMKEILNLKIKRRESFRPFAPSILREDVCDWFEEEADVPFMMQVFQIKEHKRKEIPAVAHVDGSGRLQTVSKENHPRYHELINNFKNKTGVPIILNTSFNENEPVVCSPQEAINCFLRTKMDILVLGNWFLQRN